MMAPPSLKVLILHSCKEVAGMIGILLLGVLAGIGFALLISLL